ncbi:MAG TPA: PAS domain-containing sensor histidine kinase [Kofleriaceae bacterium]|nr:PAS domain-containing sensor histidine kinase [Kofleriaceae bacterium]
MRPGSLAVRYAALCLALCALTAVLAMGLDSWLGRPWLSAAVSVAVMAPVAVVAAWRHLSAMLSLFRALTGTVGSYRDGDFSFSLTWPRNDELRDLVCAHNDLGQALRDQRLGLVERELLLDTMVQHTPVAMFLVDPAQRVVYSNLAAKKLIGDGRRLEGRSLSALLDGAVPALVEAIDRGGDGLFVLRRGDGGGDGDDETFHLLRRRFRLNGRGHELFLLRRLTTELRRQEVQTWKNVIRVISHELNNSLAPIVSLAHSGKELLAKNRLDPLVTVFSTVEERARHLDRFIQGYARFAKLPAPRIEPVALPAFIDGLRKQVPFAIGGTVPAGDAWLDAAQIEQALLNVLKNAHESGSPAGDVTLSARRLPGRVRIDVADRGQGMSDAVLANALTPFYSTKRSGTGLGLALTREIAEAHGGRVALARRDGGGLVVTLVIPQ